MVILELIGELLARIFLEILFQGIILKGVNAIGKGIQFFKVKILGLQVKPTDPIKELENKFLNKRIKLTEDLSTVLSSGQIGKVLKVVNKNAIMAEFYDNNGNPIELKNEKAFLVRFTQFKIKR